jgi:ADP-heptose:LPS heptosyltransferase
MPILVMRGGGVGDFILTLPALAALRGRFPGDAVEILGCPPIAALAVAGGLARRVRAIESRALTGFFAREGTWTKEAAEYFAGFELIISYLHDPEGIFQSNVSRCTGARFMAGPHRPDEALKEHAAVTLLRPLEALGIRGFEARPRLELPGAPERLAGRWLALHPGSGSARKNWPEAKWATLLGLLAGGTDWNFLLIGGEAEGTRCRRLAARLPRARVDLAENLPLVELAQKMRSCAAYIGHDSGITHLAAALDLPGLVLWGPTDETTWRPASEKLRLIPITCTGRRAAGYFRAS